MRLNYRGSSYTSTSQNIETVTSKISAHFLGQTYQIRRAVQPSSFQSSTTLQFRGSLYFRA
ncbi:MULTISPECIES: DUF4278 domain-containing protein [Nostocales]|uniref:DUF4278 domain-containing protein n=3 Tax=Nostocales TaxID=1161 RepID=A0A0C1R3N1_9CYAN|nr:DUF4278 domain-containing protein [Tolypothrix bouteillei]KAF3886369.1 DUF4278 domain-containing protein [Tolypothrix bouteillei VB521301]